ncbi:hypothetical protein MCP1_50031 [Candidatus Terasakiella magnetica]|nr:hypothetical protein MCP1_50031 [Candidatus Terasakiella magnetica]
MQAVKGPAYLDRAPIQKREMKTVAVDPGCVEEGGLVKCSSKIRQAEATPIKRVETTPMKRYKVNQGGRNNPAANHDQNRGIILECIQSFCDFYLVVQDAR